jgi:ATP-dependent Clp protease ATP-binding subunit ClpC
MDGRVKIVFERFTDRARRTVVLAQEEARLLHHGHIGTEHLLLGLIHEGEGLGAKVLEQLGISLEAARAAVEKAVEPGTEAPEGHIPFTPRAKKALELSLREALVLKHNYIGTEHILLGILREGEGLAARVLLDLGADLAAARQHVIAILGPVRSGRSPGTRPFVDAPRALATPAALKVAIEARRLARGARVGSQHYLLGLLAEEQSLAAKVLTALGVTRESVEQKLAELDTTGTSDESPEEAGARRMSLRVEADRLVLEVDDPDQAAKLRQAASGGVEVRTITGDDPEARSTFPELYAAVSRAVDDMAGRLPPTLAPFHPPDWDPARHAAFYTVSNGPDGPVGRLRLAPGTDEATVAAWLRAWIDGNRAALAGAASGHVDAGVAGLRFLVDRAGDGLAIQSFGVIPEGPPGSLPVPLGQLVDAALADLAPS